MRSTVESLEGNKVKLVVELEEIEFEKDLDAAFARLAKEVRLPGFRPGKAPRKVLEARIGQGYAREEAFREALPGYYSEAVKEHEVDVIAPPEIDITTGLEEGPVAFDAVVEIRPSIEIEGYDDMKVELPAIEVSDEDLDEQVDRMRTQFSDLEAVERAAAEGDRIVIDIAATHGGEEIPGMTTEGYTYEVGSDGVGIPEFDENLTGASAGDELEFTGTHPDPDEEDPIEFSVKVSEVQELVLPEPTDEWIQENSEFETLDEMRDDYRDKMGRSRIFQAQTVRRNNVAEQLAELVETDDVPEALVEMEFENRIQDLAMRLQAQGIGFDQYLQFSGQDRDSTMADLRDQAATSAKLDLALRAVAAQESIEVTEDDLTEELTSLADRLERSLDDVRAEFEQVGSLPALRSDLVKNKALEWLIDRAELVDEDGRSVSPDALELPDDEADEESEEDQT